MASRSGCGIHLVSLPAPAWRHTLDQGKKVEPLGLGCLPPAAVLSSDCLLVSAWSLSEHRLEGAACRLRCGAQTA
eukprot:3862949-Amphidinium_carterae.1